MKTLLSIITCALILSCAPSTPDYISKNVTALELQRHIKYLASPELEGRRAGEEGNRKAANYIAHEFESYGLLPAGDHGTYFQSFDFISTVKMGEKNSLSADIHREDMKITIPFELKKDFQPMAFSIDTSFSAPVVFVGYGITNDSMKYDDYAGVDVKNKIVAVLRYTPNGSNDSTSFVKSAASRTKAFIAREKGASGMIFMTGPLDDPDAKLMSFIFDRGFGTSGIAAVTMSSKSFDSLLHTMGKDLSTIQQGINTSKKPNSFELPNVTMHLSTELVRVHAQSANICGYLPGNDPVLKDDVVILGAHMDHLGYGGEGSGSLKPDTIAIHPGADDNGSGTAGLLEAAQYFAPDRAKLKRTVLFLSFTGEELGLLGSDYYVKNPFFPLGKTTAMLNMDMIGRLKDSILVVEGMGTSPQWEKIVKKENPDSSLKLKLKPDGYGPSDHASFYGKDIPVMFFFTNIHSDYHRPSDTWDKINYPGEQQVVEYVTRILWDIDTMGTNPTFTKVAMAAPSERGEVRVSLGVIPDFAEDIVGMKITGTRPGSAADKAGLKANDVIVKFGGSDVKNIYDFTYLLGKYKPKDEVEIVVKRGTEQVTLHAILGGR
ncbi:MAG: M20/M25/M40 family metallo-hydrolase [Bacteroidota bacterium]